jgi:hypothetical protein
VLRRAQTVGDKARADPSALIFFIYIATAIP